MNAKKLLISFLSIALGAGILGGCSSNHSNSSGNGGPIVIKYWSVGPSNGVSQVIKNFNKKYKGKYKVEFTAIPYSNKAEKVNSALSAHRGPDIMEEAGPGSVPYIRLGLVLPIQPILKLGGIDPQKDFAGPAWNGDKYRGKHYVAPVDALPTILYYNKALFKKAGLNPNQPPKNKKEFLKDAKALTNPKKGQWGYIQQPGWPNQFLFPSFIAQFGGKQANPKTLKVLFNQPPGKKALQFEWNCIYKWHISPPNASANQYINEFIRGKNAMVMDGAYDFPQFKKALGKKLGVALLPVIGKQPANFYGENSWWVFKNASMTQQKKKGIGLFMKYFYVHWSPLAAKSQLLPLWKPYLNTAEFKKIPGMEIQYKALQHTVPAPMVNQWGNKPTTRYLYRYIDKALLNQMPVGKALDKGAMKTQVILNSYKKQ